MSESAVSPERTLAIIFGASAWPNAPHLDPADSFAKSAAAFALYLTDPHGFGLPAANLCNLFDDEGAPGHLLFEMSRFVRQRRSLLEQTGASPTDVIVYYVGHGGFDEGPGAEFFFAIRSSWTDHLRDTSITARALWKTLREECRKWRQFVIADCCFAGAGAVDRLQSPYNQVVATQMEKLVRQGSVYLGAADRGSPAKAPRDAEFTMFSGALLSMLRDGDAATPSDHFSFQSLCDAIAHHVRERFGDRAVPPVLHCPDQSEGRVSQIPLFRNPAGWPDAANRLVAPQPVPLAGAILAPRGYLDAREKERQDRLDTDRKEREDQFAKILNDTITRLVSNEARQRVVGAAGLVPFFTPERRDFHLQALIALIAAARNPEELPEVKQGLRIAFERAIRAVPNDVLVQVSWQRVKLPTINLAGRDLRGLDLRDADLQNASLSAAKLDDADLSAAKLQGAKLNGARLTRANLTYADLAGASLANAQLAGARLDNIQVLNLDLDKADFTSIGPGWRGVPWDATRNWREAVFDADVRLELDARYGPAVPPLRVLMLMWESPPLINGGTWTACYHLVRNLRRRGAQVTVVVPWHHDIILKTPFGSEVPIVALGIVPPDDGGSPYGGAASSAYGHGQADRGYVSWSPYGGSGTRLWSGYGGSSGGAPSGSPYGGTSPLWSGYVGRGDGAPYSYGGPYGSYGIARPSLSGSILFRLIGEFRRRLEAYVRDHPADLIHAHDWVTFDAARAAASRIGVPWIAHFHSTEADRQPDGGDPLTERVEQGAVDSANRIVAPSATTKGRLVDLYRAAAARIDVVPNVLSEGAAPTADMGRFETKRVIFLGRLSRQKGVDRFCDVADTVRRAGISAGFEAFGDGDERELLARHDIAWRGAVGWDKRGEAFRGASVMVVPSRAEPFGMVILEAMQYRVPVIYPIDSGAAEVLESGIKVRTDNTKAMADHVVRLLGSLPVWESTVRAQAREIEGYPGRVYEDRLMAVWQQSGARATAPT